MSAEVPVGVYFYPQTTSCEVGRGRSLAIGREVVDETILVAKAQPLFEGHRQPRTYCLGDPKDVNWDDADPIAMSKQTDLIQETGFDFVIFDAYGGILPNGSAVRERNKPLQTFQQQQKRSSLRYAVMWCMDGPRVDLPAPAGIDRRQEPNRGYPQSAETARFIVDQCASLYWGDSNYFHIKDRPYLSIFNSFSPDTDDTPTLNAFVETIKEYAWSAYRLEPYTVAVERKARKTHLIADIGLDGVSGYAFLPNFNKGAPPIQEYASQVQASIQDWSRVAEYIRLPFVPPAVVGWDASPRGTAGVKMEEVIGRYPYTPIVINNTPDEVACMLRRTLDWTRARVPEKERYGVVCAWNEITEGCSLLPEVIDGRADFSYITAIRRVLRADS